jgi:hypothetical protein
MPRSVPRHTIAMAYKHRMKTVTALANVILDARATRGMLWEYQHEDSPRHFETHAVRDKSLGVKIEQRYLAVPVEGFGAPRLP